LGDQQVLESAEYLYRNHQPEAAKSALDSVFSIGKNVGLLAEFFATVLAYNFSSKGDEQILDAILHKNIELFPRSSTAYETLAYAYLRNGDKELIEGTESTKVAPDPPVPLHRVAVPGTGHVSSAKWSESSPEPWWIVKEMPLDHQRPHRK
jgi:hypothetical protein